MVERVAMAIVKSNRSGEDRWGDLLDTERDGYMANARAVIEALMEPTPEMLEAAVMAHFEFLASGGAPQAANFARFIFQAMLRTALSQPNEEGDQQ